MQIPKYSLGQLPTPPSNVLALLTQAAAKYNIPPDILVAQAAQESGFNQTAISPAGAIGVMQLMPATAADLGVDPNNIQQNIDGGAQYLAQQYARFGSWDLALAAYNAGGGNVSKAGNAIPNFPETQNYVAKILGNAPQYASLLGVGQPATPAAPDSTVTPDTSVTAADVIDTSGSSEAGILGGGSSIAVYGIAAVLAYATWKLFFSR